jgi:hypothetical protein
VTSFNVEPRKIEFLYKISSVEIVQPLIMALILLNLNVVSFKITLLLDPQINTLKMRIQEQMASNNKSDLHTH